METAFVKKEAAQFLKRILRVRKERKERVLDPFIASGNRLGLAQISPTPAHVIVIVEFESQTIGLLADAVRGILDVSEDAFTGVAELDSGLAGCFLSGPIDHDEQLYAAIALDKIVDQTILPDRPGEAASAQASKA